MSEELIYDLLRKEGGGLSIRGIANKLYDGDKQIAKEFCFKLSTHPDIEKFVWLDGSDAYRIRERKPEPSKKTDETKERIIEKEKGDTEYERHKAIEEGLVRKVRTDPSVNPPKEALRSPEEKETEPRKGSQGPKSPFNWKEIDPKLIIRVKELDEKRVPRVETYETIAKEFDLGITTATKRISFLAKNGLLESYPNRTKNMLLEDKTEAKARFDKYSHRFKDKDITVIGQGNRLETVAWMEKTHPELTTEFKPKKRGPKIEREPELSKEPNKAGERIAFARTHTEKTCKRCDFTKVLSNRVTKCPECDGDLVTIQVQDEEKTELRKKYQSLWQQMNRRGLKLPGLMELPERVKWMEKELKETPLKTALRAKREKDKEANEIKRDILEDEREQTQALQERIDDYKRTIRDNDKEIDELKTEIMKLSSEIGFSIGSPNPKIIKLRTEISDKNAQIDRLKHSLANEIDKVKELTTQLRRKKEKETILNTTHPRHYDTEEDLQQTHLGGIVIIADTVTITKQCKETRE